jgi:hypothetical protein
MSEDKTMLHKLSNKYKQCERCGSKDNVHSTLVSVHSYPHEDDVLNTPENLPFGCSMLCDKCDEEYYAQACAKMADEETRCRKVAQAELEKALRVDGELTQEQQDEIYWVAYNFEMYDLAEVQDEQGA